MARPKKQPPPPRQRRGSGSITRLANGRLRARLPPDAQGRRRARDFPADARDEARAWLAAMLQPGTVVATVTLGDWSGAWHETYVAPVRPPNTARWYLYALRHLEPHYGLPLSELRPSQLQAVVAQLAGTLSPATVLGIVGVWRRMLAAAVDDEHLARNPAARLTLPQAGPRTVKRHVTTAEVTALWPAIRGHRFEAAYALLLGCGLRIGEVLGLAWEHVDLANHRAWISRQWTNSHWRELPKGRNPHWVRLPSRVEAALIRHRDRQPAGAVLVMQSPHVNNHGPHRRTPGGPRPWSAQVVGGDLDTLLAQLELTNATPHAFRRGLVTALLDGGASPAVVAEIAGHADQATTLRSYAGRSAEARQQAAEIVDRYLGDGPPAGVSGDETA